MTAPDLVLLPGDCVPADRLPAVSQHDPVRLGSGVRLLLTESKTSAVVSATHAGLLSVSESKRRHAAKTVTVHSFPRRRYMPTANDLVIAQIHHSSQDYFYCNVTPQLPHALLGQLAFENATKKTRPVLRQGECVYARVLSVGVGPGAELELTCVDPATGKAEPGGLGPLTAGMLFDVSVGMAARLMRASAGEEQHGGAVAGLLILDELSSRLESLGGFELAVGKNGRVWVDCSNSGENAVRATVAVGRCITETDQRRLGLAEQRKLVASVWKQMKLDAS